MEYSFCKGMGYVSCARPLLMTGEAGLIERKLIHYLEYLKPARYVPSRLKKGKPLRLALWLVIFLEPPLMEKKGECLTIHFLSLVRKDIWVVQYSTVKRGKLHSRRGWCGLSVGCLPSYLAFLSPINPAGWHSFPQSTQLVFMPFPPSGLARLWIATYPD